MAQPKNNQRGSYVTSIESPCRAESKNIFTKKFGSPLTKLRGFEFWGSGTTPISGAFWSQMPKCRRLRAEGPRWHPSERTFEGRRPEMTSIWADIRGPKARDDIHLSGRLRAEGPRWHPSERTFEGRRPEMTSIWTDVWGPKARDETHLNGHLRAEGPRRNPSERTFEGRRPEMKPIWADVRGF